jgi:hypothetical protein
MQSSNWFFERFFSIPFTEKSTGCSAQYNLFSSDLLHIFQLSIITIVLSGAIVFTSGGKRKMILSDNCERFWIEVFLKSLCIDYIATYLTLAIFSFQTLPKMKTVTVTSSYKRDTD